MLKCFILGDPALSPLAMYLLEQPTRDGKVDSLSLLKALSLGSEHFPKCSSARINHGHLRKVGGGITCSVPEI